MWMTLNIDNNNDVDNIIDDIENIDNFIYDVDNILVQGDVAWL